MSETTVPMQSDELVRRVELALRSSGGDAAAEVLAGTAATLRRTDPALLDRLAGETLAAGVSSRLLAVVLLDLRAAHRYQAGDLAAAIELYRAAVEQARQAQEPRVICHALNNLGNALSAVDAHAAAACFAEAIERARGRGLIDEELINLNNLCVTWMDAGELEQAGDAFDFAIRRVDETRCWQTYGNVIVGNLGTFYARTGQQELASTFLRRALDVATAAGDGAMCSAWIDGVIGVK